MRLYPILGRRSRKIYLLAGAIMLRRPSVACRGARFEPAPKVRWTDNNLPVPSGS